MSHALLDASGGQATRRARAVQRAADWLALAAAPTFTAMALLSAFPGDASAQMLCSAGAVSPMNGMVAMYLLMSAFHLPAWLKLVRMASAGNSP